MKVKPTVLDEIKTRHTSFAVNLVMKYNITFICGDSGVGKSALYSLLEEYAAEQKMIVCFNYLDKSKRYRASIKQRKNTLFVIDNADILLDDELREYIAMDDKNQYIIIGRNPTGLLLQQDEIWELDTAKDGDLTTFSLRHGL